MQKKAHLFIFEGVDGVGKTTLAHKTVAYLQANNLPCIYLSSPGSAKGTLGEHVYRLHHNELDVNVKKTEATSLQALHIAAHMDTVENHIKPAINAGTNIVLDRTWWSTLVYGRVYGANLRALELLVEAEKAFWDDLHPDAVFLVHRSEPIKRERTDTWKRLALEYQVVFDANQNSMSCHKIENAQSLEIALEQILQQILLITRWDLSIDQNQLKKKLRATPHPNKGQRFSSLTPAETTHVFDSYWMFAAERQSIFFERVAGNPPPWTTDPVLAKHRFTNAYRASDRVSQYLIQNVIYKDTTLTPEDVFFRIILFKIFNKIRTWEILEKQLGEIHYEDYSFAEYDNIIMREMEKGNSVFSAAYIMPSGSSAFGNTRKHRNYLKLLEKMMNEDVPAKVLDIRRMRDAFEILLGYPTIGEFLAYQFVIDLNYSYLTNFSEMEFVMPGPGARSGIRKCFKTTGGLSDMDIIRLVADLQEQEFERRNIDFQTLWGRPLQLIDCQNLFCEVDKYARVVHPDVQGIGKRSRIKQKYDYETKPRLSYWYPPKWGINEEIKGYKEDIDGD